MPKDAVLNPIAPGAEGPITFKGRIDDALHKWVPKGTALARVSGPHGDGWIVTNGPMFLSSKASLVVGSQLSPSEYMAAGAAEGEDIPYGKPYCIFVAQEDSPSR